MIRLRAYKHLIAATTAFAVLLQAVLLAACPHPGQHSGAKATTQFDAVLGWLMICNNSGRTADDQSPNNHQRTDHDCCTAICAAALLTLIAFVAALLAVLLPDRQGGRPLRRDPCCSTQHLLHYGGRGSRAPPAYA